MSVIKKDLSGFTAGVPETLPKIEKIEGVPEGYIWRVWWYEEALARVCVGHPLEGALFQTYLLKGRKVDGQTVYFLGEPTEFLSGWRKGLANP